VDDRKRTYLQVTQQHEDTGRVKSAPTSSSVFHVNDLIWPGSDDPR